MLEFDAAVAVIKANVPRLDPIAIPLAEVVGTVLAEDVVSDVDMPPFDKSAMDGFAVRAADLATVPCTLDVIEDIPAGTVPTRTVGAGQCARIMTGAPVPDGADTVVRVEDTDSTPGATRVTVQRAPQRGRNICPRAEDVRVGQVVLEAGHLVRAPETALLAGCGKTHVNVFRRPRVAVLSTGDEVVPIDRVPQPGQIRDANSHYVCARLEQALAIDAVNLGIAPDDPDGLRRCLAEGLTFDVLLVSGGVSMGDYDLVPGLLAELGVAFHFKQVAMQPGRPTVFGRRADTVLLGLPGNPVSVMVVTELFVLPALRTMMGHAQADPPLTDAQLEGSVRHKPNRRAHVPGALQRGPGGGTVRALPYHGSAHVHALSLANAFIVVPKGVAMLEGPARVQVIELRT